ncbi:MAG: AAA family ATPase [Rikenellaceae bacterium]
MGVKRIRIFAGPNGSGKSSVYNHLLRYGEINLGIFVNADEIENALKTAGALNLNQYGIVLDFTHFLSSYKESSFYVLSGGEHIYPTLRCDGNVLYADCKESINSYFAAFITDYVRVAMLDSVDVFTVETVMSHRSKLDYVKLAKSKGYRVYLYFVSTEDPQINISRVAYRVKSGGHNVPTNKIVERYKKSLDNLYDALILSDRAYVFDNSEINLGSHILYAEYNEGELSFEKGEVPYWIDEYLIKKIDGI